MTTTASILQHVNRLLRRFRWLIAGLGLAIAAYAAAGFLLVPYLARQGIVNYVEHDLGRHVAIGKLTFNPFTLTVEITGFALTEADGAPIASFDLLHVNAEIVSLFNGAATFKEVRLERPNISVLINSDGTLNLAKLAPPSEKPQPSSGVPAIRIGTFAVHGGRIGLEDRSRPRPFATTLTPIEFTLTNFRTAPNFQNAYSFAASTAAGEKLTWSGEFSVQPFGSKGRFAVSAFQAATAAAYLQDSLPFDLRSGSFDLNGEYTATVEDKLGLQVDLPTLKIKDLALAPRNTAGTAPWITLPSIEITRAAFSLADRKLTAEQIAVDNAKLTVWREPDGQLNLMQLFGAPATAAAAAPAPATASVTPPPAAAPAFTIGVNTIAIRAASVDAEDRAVTPAAKFNLSPIALTISGYSTAPGTMVKIDANVGVGKGRVAAQGDLTLSPMVANVALDVADFELPPLQPYIGAATAMELTSGAVSTKAKLDFAAEPARGKPQLQFSGDVTVANLATRDSASRQDFIKWQSLRLAGIDYQQGPDRLTIQRIEAVKPFGRVFVTPDQTLNVVAIIAPPKGAGTAAATPVAATTTAAPAKAPAKTSPMTMRIGTVQITDGTADFADYSVQPNFAAGILALNGTVSGLSSDPNSRAEVKLTGSVDKFAPVDISGKINVLSAAVFTDIALNFRNMELTTFNPYSGKYAGYNISKGKLTTELHYKVENRKLDAQHHIVLDQLEFGGATNSKDAVPLPVRLAVALLKDRDGVMDLNLPVSGSLDDPQFRLGPIIWQAVVNLLTKIVTAPFALVGSLFGGGEELAYVDFHAGSAVIAPDQQEKLTKLAKALAERPQLRLDIPLETVAPADTLALSQAAFDAALTPMLPMGANATPEQRLAALTELYQQQMGAPPIYPTAQAMTVADVDVTATDIKFLEDALKTKFEATDAQRNALARARADAVQAAILSNTEVMPERVFLTERQSGKSAAEDSARMELSLQ